MSPDGHEELHVRLGSRSGLQLAVAVHSTALGPALGGARLWGYESPGDAVADSLRLSEAMTLKAAAAGLDLGGGKSALCAPGDIPAERRRALMLDLGDLVESLDGRYVVAEDVGTTTDDMTVIAERTSHVVGLPAERGGTGDPSPSTARGVAAAMRAACSRRLGTADLSGVRVCIIGLGHVGTALAKILAGEGVELLASDIRSEHRRVGAELGAAWLDPGDATGAECDVLAPCALGGAIDESAAEVLRCSVVCGSANNQLADQSVSQTLHRRGILYAPDFIANAGGLINVYAELHSLPSDRVARLVEGIGDTVGEVLDEAESCGLTPLDSALDLARARLEEARPRSPARLTA
jgi:leucine dehydrogenase